MTNYTEQYKVNLPERSLNGWSVERRTVEDNLSLTIFNFKSHGRDVPPGVYTYLKYPGGVMMSDTPAEIRDCYPIFRAATGSILINGLGLGVVTQAIMRKPDVDLVTVIEIQPEVIELVGTVYKQRYGDRLRIIQADALTYKAPKGERFNAVWHDIWPDLCTTNLEDMHRLHRKYGRRCDWQGSWCRGLLEYRLKQENRQVWY